MLPAARATLCCRPGVTTNASTIDSATRREMTKRRKLRFIGSFSPTYDSDKVSEEMAISTTNRATRVSGRLNNRLGQYLELETPYSGQESIVERLLIGCLRVNALSAPRSV